MFWQSSAVIPAHTPGTDGASRAPHLRVSLVAHSASDFAGAASRWISIQGFVLFLLNRLKNGRTVSKVLTKLDLIFWRISSSSSLPYFLLILSINLVS